MRARPSDSMEMRREIWKEISRRKARSKVPERRAFSRDLFNLLIFSDSSALIEEADFSGEKSARLKSLERLEFMLRRVSFKTLVREEESWRNSEDLSLD